uniref:lysophospholipid acyltransferase family protein n=2 Tax=Dissulfurimicrobium sp. TaxID=2022436 RepID=UPI004048F9F5
MKVREVLVKHNYPVRIKPATWIRGLIFTLADLWLSSCRPVIVDSGMARSTMESGRPFIIALWHFSLIYILFHFRTYPAAIMVSGSADGDWVARYITRWGQVPVRGSRLKGGVKAIKDMAQAMKLHNTGAGIVADGSRGPARIAQKGAIILSRDTGAPIIPVGFAARPAIRFNSWDKTLLPWPFSRVAIAYGQPFYVDKDSRGQILEIYRKHLEDELNKATAEAEAIFDNAKNNL